MPVKPRLRRFIPAVACLTLVVGACSGDDDDSASPSEKDTPAGDDAASADDVATGGRASITIDGETWTFDSITCATGEETGVPGAELNASASDGSISLYVAAEGDDSYIELADLETMDDGGLNYTTTGIGTPAPSIDVDGDSFSASADFYSVNDIGGLDGPVEGTVSGSCSSSEIEASSGDESDDTGRPFDVDREGLAEALATGTGADDVEVDGETIRLVFDDGSVDAPTATINCSVANQLKAADDRVELVYPDGVLACDAAGGN